MIGRQRSLERAQRAYWASSGVPDSSSGLGSFKRPPRLFRSVRRKQPAGNFHRNPRNLPRFLVMTERCRHRHRSEHLRHPSMRDGPPCCQRTAQTACVVSSAPAPCARGPAQERGSTSRTGYSHSRPVPGRHRLRGSLGWVSPFSLSPRGRGRLHPNRIIAAPTSERGRRWRNRRWRNRERGYRPWSSGCWETAPGGRPGRRAQCQTQ